MSSINVRTSNVYASGLQQKTQSMKTMFSALEAGDFAKAQSAYSSSGLPAMATKNTTPLGRLFNALRNDDLPGAQKAALDMQGKKPKKDSVAVTPSKVAPVDPRAKIKAAAMNLVQYATPKSAASDSYGSQGSRVNFWA